MIVKTGAIKLIMILLAGQCYYLKSNVSGDFSRSLITKYAAVVLLLVKLRQSYQWY
jgi:hypothetical protein